MPQDQLEASYFSPDILEFIRLLHAHQVRYVVVGGEAVIYYGHARLTGDIDFFYDSSHENALAVELHEEGVIIQFGRPPNRIDLLNRIDAVDFAEAWEGRVTVTLQTLVEEFPLYYLGLEHLLRNKQACARPKDQEDLKFLRQIP